MIISVLLSRTEQRRRELTTGRDQLTDDGFNLSPTEKVRKCVTCMRTTLAISPPGVGTPQRFWWGGGVCGPNFEIRTQPISDQNLWFSVLYFRPEQKFGTPFQTSPKLIIYGHDWSELASIWVNIWEGLQICQCLWETTTFLANKMHNPKRERKKNYFRLKYPFSDQNRSKPIAFGDTYPI